MHVCLSLRSRAAGLAAMVLSLFTAAAASADPLVLNVPMRDGTELVTYVYLPEGKGPFPTLVARTVYGPPITPMGGELFDRAMFLADYEPPANDDDDDEGESEDDERALALGWPLLTQNGYAFVVQITRGRKGSGGIDRTWRDDRSDGYDLVEWVNDQPWSNGRIGIFGDSAVGISAALAAAAAPPSLDAVFVQASAGDPIGTDMAPLDGAFRTESLLLQGGFLAFDVSPSHVAARNISEAEASGFATAVRGYVQGLSEGLGDPLASPDWAAAPLGASEELGRLMPFWSMFTDPAYLEAFRRDTNVIGEINIPTSVVTLWQDSFAESAIALYADLEARGVPAELLVVNGTHYEVDDPRIFPAPRLLSWFDHWLKDAPAPVRKPVVAAIQGSETFSEADRLGDLFTTPTRLHLSPAGALVERSPVQGAVTFTSDPSAPILTTGGRNLLAPSGQGDQTALIDRPDTAAFVGAAFTKPTLLAGPVTGTLSMRSDAPSFDASVRLLDLAPDGKATLILSDHRRITKVNGQAVDVSFDMGEILHRFPAGHRAAVVVAGSDFPAWDRNPQTGKSIFSSAELRRADLTILTGPGLVSRIDLPLTAEAPAAD